ncbi:hypothetical protein PoB_006566100, partial [Plakobranchus ocellatus]
ISEQGRTEHRRLEQGRTEHRRSEQGRTEHRISEQGRTEHRRSEQGRTEHRRSEQSSPHGPGSAAESCVDVGKGCTGQDIRIVHFVLPGNDLDAPQTS